MCSQGTEKIKFNLIKHHFLTFQKYPLEIFIHYFKLSIKKYFHAVLMYMGNVAWVILILPKSHQVSFSIYLQTLFNLLVDLTIVYFLTWKEMYILVEIMSISLGIGHNTNQNVVSKISNTTHSNNIMWGCKLLFD